MDLVDWEEERETRFDVYNAESFGRAIRLVVTTAQVR